MSEAGSLARRTLVVAGVTAAMVVALLFVWYARDVLLLVFAGILAAVFLRRIATALSDRTPLSPTWSLAVVVVTLVLVFVGTFALRGPAIAAEVATLQEELPKAAERLQDQLAGYAWGKRILEAVPNMNELLPDARGALTQATGVLSRTMGAFGSLLIVAFLGIVFAASPASYVNGVVALLPEAKVARGREVFDRLYDTLWWWLIGRFISMAVVGIATFVGLLLLDIPLALVLAVLAALLTFIPNLGPVLALLPALLLALAQGPQTALWVALLYGGIQVVETYAIAPVVDRRTISMPPAFTVIAQLVMALFGGILGIALATPLAAVAVVLVTMLYVQDGLGKRHIAVDD